MDFNYLGGPNPLIWALKSREFSPGRDRRDIAKEQIKGILNVRSIHSFHGLWYGVIWWRQPIARTGESLWEVRVVLSWQPGRKQNSVLQPQGIWFYHWSECAWMQKGIQPCQHLGFGFVRLRACCVGHLICETVRWSMGLLSY